MESIYFVISWLCHRTCDHCYEDRFRPYHGSALEGVVETSKRNVPRIIENLPADVGRIILAGGEVLLDAIREPVLYPALDQLRAKYPRPTELVIQTTGDLLTEVRIAELLEHGVDIISVSGMDDFHDGLARLRPKVEAMLEKSGARFSFFGATPDAWIGKIWPRGRAFANELSTATLDDNFCNGWSGGLNFLKYKEKGSEVSIDPEGNVYPCCPKTRLAIGNVAEEPLEQILERLGGDPVYEAISAGQPQRMGLAHGWSEEKFLQKSTTILPSGRVYRNLCIGCDRFHDEVLTQIAPA